MEDEKERITDADNVTADALSHASGLYRENLDNIFTNKKLDKSDKLINAINNLTINSARYELNKANTSDAQGNLTINSYTVTHTSNVGHWFSKPNSLFDD